MTLFGIMQLGLATLIFLFAATAVKYWALAPSTPKLLLTMVLYIVGNLLMLRLVRDFGMATAFSLSAVLQLVAVNLIALLYFGERLNAVQGGGLALAVVAVVMITFGPEIGGR